MKLVNVEDLKVLVAVESKGLIRHGKLVSDLFDDIPTVDAEPVRHGHWEMKADPYGFFDKIPVCSECGCTTKMRETYKYCPNCGAKMDLEKENADSKSEQ